jgi:hypothetical protein
VSRVKESRSQDPCLGQEIGYSPDPELSNEYFMKQRALSTQAMHRLLTLSVPECDLWRDRVNRSASGSFGFLMPHGFELGLR